MTARDKTVASGATAAAPAGSHLRGIFGALERLGFDLDGLLAPFGVRRAEVDDKDSCLAGNVCEAVLRSAAREGRAVNLPLKIAFAMPKGSNPLLDYLVASSDTVGDGIERLSRFLYLVSPQTSVAIEESANLVRIRVEAPDPFRAELTTAMSVLRLTEETNGQLRVERVCFRHDVEEAAEYERELRCAVETRAGWDGWELTREGWRLPLTHSDPTLRRWLEQRAAQMMAKEAAPGGVTLDVRRTLGALLGGGEMSIESAARRLATAPRTLQRKLAAQGTTFETLRDLTRREAAEAFLADAKLSVSEVAYLVGFSEPGAFHRAFKRWHGSTPQQYRESAGEV